MSNKLFVGNLAWSVTSEMLKEIFMPFGRVIDARVLMDRQTGRSRGFGFVTFENEADADRATAEMHNQEIEGRAIRCDNTSQQQSDRRERRPREERGFRGHDENRREGGGYRSREEGGNAGYRSRDEGGYRGRDDSRPRRDFHRDDTRPNHYDNYDINAFPPDPDKQSRNDRRHHRRKDRNYDDDDRW